MPPQNHINLTLLIIAMLLIATVSGIGVYLWQQNTQTKICENQRLEKITAIKNIIPAGQYATMTEYVDSSENNHGSQPPKDFVRIEYKYDKLFKGLPLDVKTSGASAPVYVYARPDWETYDVQAIQVFYLKFINPMYSLENPKISKPEYWSGPLYGKLKLLF